MEKIFVSEIGGTYKEGDKITSIFLLRKNEALKTQQQKEYLVLAFEDKSGSIEGRMWDNATEEEKNITINTVVKISGTVSLWKNTPQIKINSIVKANEEEYDINDIMRTAGIVALMDKLKACLQRNITHEIYKDLLTSFFADKEFMEKFKKSSAAHAWHHAYVGGLLEHTVEVMLITEEACKHYSDQEVDREIAIVGAFIHDIGKINELDDSFEYTLEGSLIGHIVLGCMMLEQKMCAMGYPEQYIAVNLLHIIASHHGELDKGSPVKSLTIESIIVNKADELSAQTNATREITSVNTYTNKEWSNYIPLTGRKYLLKKKESE